MFVEFMAHAFALDLDWIISLIMSNLHYLFAFAAVVYFFLEGKKVILGVIIISLLLWAVMDLGTVAGFVVFVGGFLIINYLTKLALLTFVEDTTFKKWLIPVSTAQAYIVLLAYNYFMV